MNGLGQDSKPKSLISIIIWISLALLLVAFVSLPLLLFGPDSGRTAMRKAAIMQIWAFGQALEMFKNDNGFYPAGTNGLNDLVVKPAGATTNWHQYLEGIPLDYWGHPYLYEYPGKYGTNAYDISSAGPDGKFGTADDIGN